MKKLLTILLSALLCLACVGMVACGNDAEGTYKFKSMTMGGQTFNIGDVAPWGDEELTADSNQIVLEKDGVAKAVSVVAGHTENQTGTWTLDGENISITIEGMTQSGTLKDGVITLTISAGGQSMTYVYEKA